VYHKSELLKRVRLEVLQEDIFVPVLRLQHAHTHSNKAKDKAGGMRSNIELLMLNMANIDRAENCAHARKET
jgi:hypothetical protein